MSVKLHTVGVVVKDMPTAIAFYRGLGLDVPAGEEAAPHVEVVGDDGYVLGFDTEEVVKRTDAHWVAPTGGQRVNLQFACATPAEVDQRYNAALAAGGRSYAAPWDAFWGQRFARVLDPDGKVVSLFADLPQ